VERVAELSRMRVVSGGVLLFGTYRSAPGRVGEGGDGGLGPVERW